ncbi:hypothetical protein ACMFMG_007524 [Clarireedia jacksonii]
MIWQLTLPPPRMIVLNEQREHGADFKNRRTIADHRAEEPHPDLQYFGLDVENHYIQGLLSDIHLNESDVQSYEIAASGENLVPFYLQVPEISSRGVTYYAMRRGYWHTKSSPPIISEVCKESRHALEVSGFSLAYGTRSNDPRTWFSFKSDVLVLMHGLTLRDPFGPAGCLDCTPWNIGQMRPDDMKRVRRLALDVRQPFSMSPLPGKMDDMKDIATAVRLFGGLEELFLALDCEGQEYLTRKVEYDDLWGIHEKELSNSNLCRVRRLLTPADASKIMILFLRFPEIAAVIDSSLHISQTEADAIAAQFAEAVKTYACGTMVAFIAQVLTLLANDKLASAIIALADQFPDDRQAEDESSTSKIDPKLSWGFLELQCIRDYNDHFTLGASDGLEFWTEALLEYSQHPGANGLDYFQFWRAKIETDLKRIRDEAVERGGRSWSVPSVHFIMIRKGKGLENV